MCFQLKCPDFPSKISGILDPRIPPFRSSDRAIIRYNISSLTTSYNWYGSTKLTILLNHTVYVMRSNLRFRSGLNIIKYFLPGPPPPVCFKLNIKVVRKPKSEVCFLCPAKPLVKSCLFFLRVLICHRIRVEPEIVTLTLGQWPPGGSYQHTTALY